MQSANGTAVKRVTLCKGNSTEQRDAKVVITRFHLFIGIQIKRLAKIAYPFVADFFKDNDIGVVLTNDGSNALRMLVGCIYIGKQRPVGSVARCDVDRLP